MWAIWVVDIVVLLVFFGYPVLLMTVGMPKLCPGSADGLLDLDDIQRKYIPRARLDTAVRIAAMAFAALLFAYGMSHAGEEPAPGFMGSWLSALAFPAAGVLGLFVGAWRKKALVRAFVREHPEWADCVRPAREGLGIGLVIGVLFGFAGALIALAANHPSSDFRVFLYLVAAIILLLFVRRLLVVAFVRTKVFVPEDSPLALCVSSVIERFGFRPKQFVMLPNFMANGWALPDGTVAITTGLRHGADDDEIAAVLAHELSHARDGDAKILSLVRATGLVFAGGLFVAAVFILRSAGCPVPVFVAFTGSGVPVVFTTMALVTSWYWRRVERKCDADTVRVGLGMQQASALTKLHRLHGLPRRWCGIHKLLLTHPSLDDRVAALSAATKATAEPPVIC